MTWVLIVVTIVFSLVKILATCLPTASVEWLLSKFRVHATLNSANVTVTYQGNVIEGDAKNQIVHHLNEAIFMESHYIWPGTEQQYLNPDSNGTPLIVDTTIGQRTVRLYAYVTNRHINIVKQTDKKVISYSLVSESLYKHLYTSEEAFTAEQA